MNKLLQSLLRRHEPDVDALSAQIDGQLGAAESVALVRHMTSCKACMTQWDALMVMKATLLAMPEVEAPRSFRLRAADVERAPAKAVGGVAGAMRLMPALSGLAAVLFVVVVVFDSSRGSGSSALKSASAPRPQAAAERDTAMAGDRASLGYRGTQSAGVDAADAATQPGPPVAAVPSSGTPIAGAGAESAPADATAPGVTDSSIPLQTAQAAASRSQFIPSPTPELSAAVQRPTDDDGSDGALRAIEVIAATVAIAAAVWAVGWRLRRRGEGI